MCVFDICIEIACNTGGRQKDILCSFSDPNLKSQDSSHSKPRNFLSFAQALLLEMAHLLHCPQHSPLIKYGSFMLGTRGATPCGSVAPTAFSGWVETPKGKPSRQGPDWNNVMPLFNQFILTRNERGEKPVPWMLKEKLRLGLPFSFRTKWKIPSIIKKTTTENKDSK